MILSPDDRFIVTGTSAPDRPKGEDQGTGSVVFIDKQRQEATSARPVPPLVGRCLEHACFAARRLEVVKRMGCKGSAVQLTWHRELNQLLVGGGDRNEGTVHIYYDPAKSKKGALMCMARAPRKADAADWEAPMEIIVPGVSGGKKKLKRREFIQQQLEKERLSRKPDIGMASSAPGRGGRIGTSQSSLFTQYLLQKHEGEIGKVLREDPREVRAAKPRWRRLSGADGSNAPPPRRQSCDMPTRRPTTRCSQLPTRRRSPSRSMQKRRRRRGARSSRP